MGIAEDLLNFWFGTADLTEMVEKRDIWFRSEPWFDAAIRRHFLPACKDAMSGELDSLKEDTAGCLALILLLDQCPRNLFRHSAHAYSADPRALSIARHAITEGYDADVSAWHRAFFYLPFEHSENIKDQNLSVTLFSQLGIESLLEAAEGHRDVIAKFGRFPHRNNDLGRKNTTYEEQFLKHAPPWGKTKAEIAAMQRRTNDKKESRLGTCAITRQKPGGK